MTSLLILAKNTTPRAGDGQPVIESDLLELLVGVRIVAIHIRFRACDRLAVESLISRELDLSVIIVGVDVEADALGGGNLILLHVLYLAGSVVDTVENPLYLLVGQVQIAELVPDLLHALLSVALT